MAETVLSEVDGPVGTILLNRPRVLNALNLEAWQAPDGALDALGRQPDLRAVILAGEGRAFCAGADLREMADPETAMAHEVEAGVIALLSEDRREGSRAFPEKRPPTFRGR